jgi:hypothetical protein
VDLSGAAGGELSEAAGAAAESTGTVAEGTVAGTGMVTVRVCTEICTLRTAAPTSLI